MRVYFERTGGFMGMRLTGMMDTTTMPEQEAVELQQIITTATSYIEQLEVKADTSGSMDTFQYRLIVDDGDERQEYEMTEESAPDEVRPLLRHLTVLARSYPAEPKS